MDDRERRICKEGMEAACRWLYEGETTREHITGGVPGGESWCAEYVADIHAIRAACSLLGVEDETLGYRAGGSS